ncbi:response regulator [Pleomorphomonas sp. NRK KF1]|uniref:response regulator n=1 Tax=Pleomorphomonas sp. NRK KF1 TaxID=2943000 RepID=UPI0020435720|nr:response regulator [Pleomorphomonas sp. NRK KF1]MCM5555844.1 response regulator [Pleomorphomonas sp. NRK KF1]
MTGGKRILVLEDEPLIAMDLEDLLSSKGFTVVGPFSTAAAALDGLGDAPLRAALLDIYLFNGTSFDVARELQQRGVRFAFMTGLVAPDVVPADLRGAPIILKPYNEKELMAFLSAELPDTMSHEPG